MVKKNILSEEEMQQIFPHGYGDGREIYSWLTDCINGQVYPTYSKEHEIQIMVSSGSFSFKTSKEMPTTKEIAKCYRDFWVC